MARVWSEKSQLGVRMPTGRTPLSFSSVSRARPVRSSSSSRREQHVALVDPAVHADLVAAAA